MVSDQLVSGYCGFFSQKKAGDFTKMKDATLEETSSIELLAVESTSQGSLSFEKFLRNVLSLTLKPVGGMVCAVGISCLVTHMSFSCFFFCKSPYFSIGGCCVWTRTVSWCLIMYEL